MSTQTSFVAEQFRLQQWANQIKDCQNRPSDMKVDALCQEHGITKQIITIACGESGKPVWNSVNRPLLSWNSQHLQKVCR